MRRETLLDYFESFADRPEIFFTYDDGLRPRQYTYAKVAGLARSFAAQLSASGIKPQDKIILYGENRPEWVIALWACLLLGAIAVPVDYRSSPELVRRIHRIVEARLTLTGDEVQFDDGETWALRDVPHAPEASFEPQRVERGQIAEIIFTSGATADPKGVVITHANVLANIVPVEREVAKYRKYSRPFAPIRFLNLLPLSHMFGQAMATFIPPMLPGVVVFMRGYQPGEIVRQIRTRRISVLVCVPKILEVLREYLVAHFPETAQAPASGRWYARWWRYRRVHRFFGWKFWSFIVGAAPLAPDLEEFFARLGFLVIQGYGLTETAPIVTLNHPFHARKGSVGKPIAGVEIQIADDGEILVRGENVTSGYYNAPLQTAEAFAGGWFHTGDIGELDANGELRIRGRKKEIIVTPEGLNVFPEDVERVLNGLPGVKDSAMIGLNRVHAVLILEDSVRPEDIVRAANERLSDHQKIRSFSLWPFEEFPRTEGTRKLRRHEIVKGSPPPERAGLDPSVPFEDLTSLERVERMIALGMDESEMNGPALTAASAGQLARTAGPAQPVKFPRWNRSRWAGALRRALLMGLVLPLDRVFAHVRSEGAENLAGLVPPVIFAPNHQSYLDVPTILAALPVKWRYRVTPAMSKEFFRAFFQHRNPVKGLQYFLAALAFNAFPLPQREAGATDAMRYIGELVADGWCPLIFPEGRMTDTGQIASFQPGVGMLASKLGVPVVPIRIAGLDRVLHRSWKMARPGKVIVRFGAPLSLSGSDYRALAAEVEAAVRNLSGTISS